MTTVKLIRLRNHKKKFKVEISGKRKKTIYFGASGYSDYTKHKDPERKKNYLARHRNENWNSIYTAGTWARFILWNKPTLRASIKDMERRFNIKIRT